MLLSPLFAAAVASAAPHCLTPFYLALRDQPLEAARVYRPTEAGFVDSAIYPLRLHWSDPAEADRVTDLILPMAERVWAIEIDQMGWPAPPPDDGVGGTDAYDIYFTREETYGGAYTWGFGRDVIPGDNWYSNPTYVAVDTRIDDADMESYLAHELNHALQWTLDGRERNAFIWEATAEAITDIVYDATAYGYEIKSFQLLPFMSLLHDSYSPPIYPYGYDGYFYEYGGMMFTTYLEEKYGTKDGTLLLQLWYDLAQPTNADEPDFLDAVAQVDPSVPSVAAVYTDFSVWRMFAASDDDGAHFEEGAAFPNSGRVFTEAEFSLADVDGFVATPDIPPFDLGATYYRIDLGAGSTQFLHVDVEGEAGTEWGIAWAVWQTAGGPAVTGSTFVADGAPLSVDVDLAGGATAQFGVINNGPPELDPNKAPPARRSFTVTLSLLDTPDTGEADPDAPDFVNADKGGGEEKAGCGCDQTPGGPGAAVALAGLALARRASRRRPKRVTPCDPEV